MAKSRYTKAELAEIKADRDYWDEFGNAVGWRLIGFTDRTHASFETGRKAIYLPSFTIVGHERDAIMRVINGERERYRDLAAHHNAQCTCLDVY